MSWLGERPSRIAWSYKILMTARVVRWLVTQLRSHRGDKGAILLSSQGVKDLGSSSIRHRSDMNEHGGASLPWHQHICNHHTGRCTSGIPQSYAYRHCDPRVNIKIVNMETMLSNDNKKKRWWNGHGVKCGVKIWRGDCFGGNGIF